MTRLTNDLRSATCEAVIKHRFTSDCDAICARSATLAERVYEKVFTKKERSLLDSLPIGFVPSDCLINVATQFGRTGLQFSGKISWNLLNGRLSNISRYGAYDKNEDIYHPVPFTARANRKTWTLGCSLADEIDQFVNDAAELSTAIDTAQSDLSATLSTFSTVEKLVKAWPEIEPFIPEPQKPKKAQLPALPVDKLNATFGLPVDNSSL